MSLTCSPVGVPRMHWGSVSCDTCVTQMLFLLQLDADRDEEEVFSDISMTVDNKLFLTREPVAGKSLQPRDLSDVRNCIRTFIF